MIGGPEDAPDSAHAPSERPLDADALRAIDGLERTALLAFESDAWIDRTARAESPAIVGEVAGYKLVRVVARGAQGRGVGGALLRALEARARAEGCASIDAEVVDLRWDLFPMYFALGFRVVGQLPFPAPERCTRPCHFVCIRRELIGASSG